MSDVKQMLIIVNFIFITFRIACCEHENFGKNCWNCHQDTDAIYDNDLCEVDCEHSDGNTISEGDLSCECADIFYGECCQYGIGFQYIRLIEYWIVTN